MIMKREYQLRSGGKVVLSVSIPKGKIGGDYTCELNIQGLKRELNLITHGADSMQPLLAAIAIANAHIKSTSEYALDELWWQGGLFVGDIGLLEHSKGP